MSLDIDRIIRLNDLGIRLAQSCETLSNMVALSVNSLQESQYDEMVHEMLHAIKSELVLNIESLDSQWAVETIEELHGKYPNLDALWVNDSKGQFLYSLPTAGIANAKVREWFTASMEGQDYSTAPYISAITKRPCITLSVPIQNKQGRILGVLGVDLQCGDGG